MYKTKTRKKKKIIADWKETFVNGYLNNASNYLQKQVLNPRRKLSNDEEIMLYKKYY